MRFISSFILLATVTMTLSPHAAEDRPKVGLVLSGGGTLGFLHTGVLQPPENFQAERFRSL